MKWTLIVCAAFFACGASAQTEPAKKEPPAPEATSIDVKKGDQWVYEFRDGLTDSLRLTISYTVSGLSDDEIDVRVRSKSPTTNAEGVVLQIYDRQWRQTESPKFTFKKSQESWGIPEGVAVGKEWSYNYEALGVDTSAHSNWAGHGDVTAWEKVTLPSGQSYDAFKIEFHEALARTSNIQTEGAPSKAKLEVNVTEWYAPSVNRYVKRTFESLQNGRTLDAGAEVLIGYSPHGTE